MRWCSAGALLAFGALMMAKPILVARHAHLNLAYDGPDLLSTMRVLQYVGISACVLGAGATFFPRLTRGRVLPLAALAIAAYLPLTLIFEDWHIDDAAITYAYVENLVRGHGLVLHPNHAPEEGYSNTLWLLMLASLRALGVDVALAAKILGTLIGALVIALCLTTIKQSTGRSPRGPAFALVVSTLLSSPFVIWTVSGLEHGLQALLMLGIVWLAGAERARPWLSAMLAGLLVLVRPEAPLLLAALGLVLAIEEWLETRDLMRVIRRVGPLALCAGGTLLALLAFRWLYFGDLLPNPYYAKAQSATFKRLLNPFGGGWMYVFGWLREGGGYVLLAPLCALMLRASPRSVRVATTLLAAQVAFVIYAEGDWMAQWRFLAAPIALAAFLVGYVLERETAREDRGPMIARFAAFASAALVLSTVPLLATFRANPTTPYLVVSEIGAQFVELAQRLGIERPLLAHHDAGGTSYRARIELLDLGGLGDRVVAKHSLQPEFLRHYILDERKPDFVFGSDTAFAAEMSHFHETEQFKRDYVRLEVDHPLMAHAPLCHVRRDRVHEAPGVLVERQDGVVVRVIVKARPHEVTARSDVHP